MAFIYGFWDPRRPIYLWEVRYLGQTAQTLQRCYERHIYSALYDPDLGNVNEWILNLLADGHEPLMLPVETTTVECLNARERAWVQEGFRQGWPLLNVQAGGGTHRNRRGRRRRGPEEAYWTNVIPSDTPQECWGWKLAPGTFGYGVLNVWIDGEKKRTSAHRLSWEIHYGPIPEGLHVCHKCDNPICSNPLHLFVGTAADNMRDKTNKGRGRGQFQPQTHCHKGHLLSGDNVIIWNGHHICRKCRCEYDREIYRKEKEAQGLTVGLPNSQKTHCPQGHEYTPENTYIDKSGKRQCRQCAKERSATNNRYPEASSRGEAITLGKLEKLAQDPEFAERQRGLCQDMGRQYGVENGKRMAAMRRQCDECGLISNPGALGQHQKKLGHQGWTAL